ncbi:unnamed protein product, partial [Brassica oleracea var. botrytis]
LTSDAFIASVTLPFSDIRRRRLLHLHIKSCKLQAPMKEDHSHSPVVSQYAAQLYGSTSHSKSTTDEPVYATSIHASPIHTSPIPASPIHTSPIHNSQTPSSPISVSPVHDFF